MSKKFTTADVEIIKSENCYKGFLAIEKLHLRCRLYEGGWSQEFTREVLQREPGVGVLLYDPDLDKVLMVEQFRVGCLDDRKNGPWALELVAGLVEQGETPPEVAIREALEEADTVIERPCDLIPICEYYNSPGGSSEKLSIFCARVDATKPEGIFGLENEAENIRTVIMSRQDAEQAVCNGIINNAMSIIAIQWLSLNLELVRATFNDSKRA